MAAIAGPKILLLMPCWLLGAWLYWNRKKLIVSTPAASGLFAFSLIADAAFYWFDISVHIRSQMLEVAPAFIEHINGSNEFAGDYVVALLVATNFLAITSLSGVLERIARLAKTTIAAMANFTLSLYLFHFSTILLLVHFGIANWIGVILSIGVPVALAPFTEFRRPQLLNFFRLCRKSLPGLYLARSTSRSHIPL